MGRIGYGYGSECHLLRWMGRHRQAFDQKVAAAIGKPGVSIQWIDFHFKPGEKWQDAERKGLDFLDDPAIQQRWSQFWPLGRGIQNWDAVGWTEGQREIILVEAKAHLGEITSDCKASSPKSEHKIRAAFSETQNALDVTAGTNDWTKRYYQTTNRLAVLYFLHREKIPAHLLFIYFVGDKFGNNRVCPQTEKDWTETLEAQDDYIGLPPDHKLAGRIHKLFLHVGR